MSVPRKIISLSILLILLSSVFVPVAVAAPIISGTNEAVIGNTSALINFQTSVPAHAYVEYGLTASYGQNTIDDPVRFYTEHAIPITGLSANTLYHYRVVATGGGMTFGGDRTFTTTSSATAPAQPADVDTRMPDMTGASTKTVKAAGGDYTSLQQAINDAAAAAEKRFITVDAGLSFTNINFPAKSGTNWVIVRPSTFASLPAEGTRVSPSDAGNMFKVTSASVDAPITTSGIASYYRVIGAEITIEDSAFVDVDTTQSGLAVVGTDTTNSVNMPHHFVWDRVYVHGIENRSTLRGIYLRAGEDLAVIDSYLSDFHGTGNDSQAVLAMANKRVKILNNYVNGAGENFMWGGDSLCCPGYEVSDLIYARNYNPWLVSWKMNDATFGTFTITNVDTAANTVTSNNHKLPANKMVRFTSTGALPSPLLSATTTTNYFACNPTANTFQISTAANCSTIVDLTTTGSGTIKGGIAYVLKNNFELKTSKRTLVFGNIIENMWPPDQDTSVNMKLERNSCRTFTVNTSTDVITGSGSPPAVDGQQVRLQNSGGALPAPFVNTTTYFVRDVAGATFKLALTQGGAAIDITSSGSGTSLYEYAFETLEDLTWYRNHQRNGPLALVIQSSLNGNGCPVGWRPGSFYGSRLSYLGNIFEVDAITWNNDFDGSIPGQAARGVFITGMSSGGSSQGPDYYVFNHNTFINAHPPANADDPDIGTGSAMILLEPDVSSGTRGVGFVYTNNIVGSREFGIFSSAGVGTAGLNTMFTGYTWNKNIVVKNTQTQPEMSLYQPTWTAVKFVNFNAGRGGNYRLASDSPGKAAGTDGLDVGADIDALARATESSIDGNWPVTVGNGGTVSSGKIVVTGKVVIQ